MNQIIKKIIFLAPLALILGYLLVSENLTWYFALLLFAAGIFAVLVETSFYSKVQSDNELIIDDQPALFVNILENLTDPLMLVNKNETILLANKSAMEMFGEETVNQQVSNLLSDSEARSAITKALDTGKSDTIEFNVNHPRRRNYLLRIHVHNKKSSGIVEDITNNRTLLLTIYDITSIREAERMRVDFVANVSHELRTPLASILGFVETLQGPAKEDQRAAERFLKIMQDEASRMLRLIEDLLSLSHIERDAHIPPDEKTSLNKIIENVIETLNIRLNARNMVAKFEPKDYADGITGDRDQLTQVFQNLVDNAIKYGAENTDIEININKYNDDSTNNEYLLVTIKNYGQGISQEHIARLTERFYRVDTARSRSLGGTGLGLAIVKHIIQRHEGKLSFESEVGKYTIATIMLPIDL